MGEVLGWGLGAGGEVWRNEGPALAAATRRAASALASIDPDNP